MARACHLLCLLLACALPSSTSARGVNWYVASGNVAGNAALLSQHGAAITGAYLCCGFIRFAANGSFSTRFAPAESAAQISVFSSAFVEAWAVGDVAEAAIHSRSWAAGLADASLASKALLADGLEGLIIDYEPADNYTHAHAEAYGDFLAALSAAVAPLRVGMDIAGWGILGADFWPHYASRGVSRFTSMTPTYDASNVTADVAFVEAAQAFFPPGAFAAGIGSMLAGGRACGGGDYMWTADNLPPFIHALVTNAVEYVDVWRCDIDSPYGVPTDDTAPFFFDALVAFLAGGKGGGVYHDDPPPQPLHTANLRPTCTYDIDCSLNGRCSTGGVCVCVQGWTGATCGELALLPAPAVGAYGGGIGGDVSSWGAGVARDPTTGLYFMYVDEMTRHCGLGTWQPNSHCVLATSPSAIGPYTKVRALQAAWCHGSALTHDPISGLWFFGHMSHASREGACTQCMNGTTPADAPSGECDADADALPYGSTVFSAPTASGPFTPAPGFLNCGNGEAFFSPDGSVAIACPEGSSTADSFFSISTAPSAAAAIAGNWSRLPQTLSVAGSNVSVPYIGFHWEDQTIWRDPRGHFHALMHAYRGQNTSLPAPGCYLSHGVWSPPGCTSLGGHAFSLDGSHWWVSPVPAYTAHVVFEGGGGEVIMRARERPHVILDGSGEVAFFLSGVGDPGEGGNTGVRGGDHSYTLIVGVGAARLGTT